MPASLVSPLAPPKAPPDRSSKSCLSCFWVSASSLSLNLLARGPLGPCVPAPPPLCKAAPSSLPTSDPTAPVSLPPPCHDLSAAIPFLRAASSWNSRSAPSAGPPPPPGVSLRCVSCVRLCRAPGASLTSTWQENTLSATFRPDGRYLVQSQGKGCPTNQPTNISIAWLSLSSASEPPWHP